MWWQLHGVANSSQTLEEDGYRSHLDGLLQLAVELINKGNFWKLSQELFWFERFPQGLVDDTLTEYAFVARIDPTMTYTLLDKDSLGSSSAAGATCPNGKKKKTTHNH